MNAALAIHSTVTGSSRYKVENLAIYYGRPSSTALYDNVVHLDSVRDEVTRGLFEFYASRWERETINMSSMTDMFNHPSYQAIIALGHDVVPILLQRLEQEPDYWFHALHLITGENPVAPEVAGSLDGMAAAWLVWGKGAQS